MNILNDEDLYTDENLENSDKYWQELYADLTSLRKEPAFQRLIVKGYMTDRALDDVSLLAHDSTVHTGKRPEVMESLVAISRLQDFFRVVENMGAPQPKLPGE